MTQVMNVKKYLQKLHWRVSSPAPQPRLLPPDLHLECGEFVLQLCDDPFEAKLRANYEVGVVQVFAIVEHRVV